jgi:hypothetical protein
MKSMLDARPAMKRTPACAKVQRPTPVTKRSGKNGVQNGNNVWDARVKNRFYLQNGQAPHGITGKAQALMVRVRLLCDLCRVGVARVIAESLG